MSDLIAEDGNVVIFHYTLTNDEGDVLDSSRDDDPMPYLHGHHNIVPGLEAKIAGCKGGETFKVTVAPEDGYGVRDKPTTSIPRDQFAGIDDLSPGMQLFTETPEGDLVPFFVADVQDDEVIIDFNHPLSGETLHFDIEVISVRKANAEEMEHGHPHGLDGTQGHHH